MLIYLFSSSMEALHGEVDTDCLYVMVVKGALQHLAAQRSTKVSPETMASLQNTTKKLPFRELDHPSREARSSRSAFLERLLMAFGIITLLGPMEIMILHTTPRWKLTAVPVATIILPLCWHFLPKT